MAVISLFCIFKILGLKNASNLGSVLGKIVGPLFRSKTVIKGNIKIGLGDINERNEKELISKMWSNIGRTFAEYIFLKILDLIRINLLISNQWDNLFRTN